MMINVRVAKEQERTLINRSYPFQLILPYTSLTDPLIFQTTEKVCASALFCMTISPNLSIRGRNRGSGMLGSVTCRPGKTSVLSTEKPDAYSNRRYRQTRPPGRSPPPRGFLRSGYALPS